MQLPRKSLMLCKRLKINFPVTCCGVMKIYLQKPKETEHYNGCRNPHFKQAINIICKYFTIKNYKRLTHLSLFLLPWFIKLNEFYTLLFLSVPVYFCTIVFQIVFQILWPIKFPSCVTSCRNTNVSMFACLPCLRVFKSFSFPPLLSVY